MPRRRVADLLRAREVALDAGRVRDVVGALRNGLHRLLHLQSRPEDGRDALSMWEVDVPGLQVLVDVRDRQVRSLPEVAAGRVAELLDVRDPRRAEARLLRRGEAEEE